MKDKTLFREMPFGVYHSLTEEEQAKVKDIEGRRVRIGLLEDCIALEKSRIAAFNCQDGHIVFDKPGWPQASRTCVVCGLVNLI